MTKKKTPPSSPPAALPLEALMGRDLSNAVVFFHETVAACVDMNVTEWKCLGLLDQHGPLPASRLAELSGFTTGAITGIVDRLERAGYVRREAHPTDRRSTIVQPLAARQIRERVSPIFQSLAKSMTKMAGKFTAAELSAISAFMTETTEILRAETARLKSEDVKKSCKV